MNFLPIALCLSFLSVSCGSTSTPSSSKQAAQKGEDLSEVQRSYTVNEKSRWTSFIRLEDTDYNNMKIWQTIELGVKEMFERSGLAYSKESEVKRQGLLNFSGPLAEILLNSLGNLACSGGDMADTFFQKVSIDNKVYKVVILAASPCNRDATESNSSLENPGVRVQEVLFEMVIVDVKNDFKFYKDHLGNEVRSVSRTKVFYKK